ncbi:hypothetical protein ACLOJK_012555 [Asimina triloba]
MHLIMDLQLVPFAQETPAYLRPVFNHPNVPSHDELKSPSLLDLGVAFGGRRKGGRKKFFIFSMSPMPMAEQKSSPASFAGNPDVVLEWVLNYMDA